MTIICGFPGVGKSFSAKMLGWHDSDSSNFSWQSPGVRSPEWPQNYIDHILCLQGTVMVSSHEEVRDALYSANVPFTLVYPSKGCKEEYIRRYRQRGSTEVFCSLVKAHWDEWLEKLVDDSRARKHIVLGSGQYISDIDISLI